MKLPFHIPRRPVAILALSAWSAVTLLTSGLRAEAKADCSKFTRYPPPPARGTPSPDCTRVPPKNPGCYEGLSYCIPCSGWKGPYNIYCHNCHDAASCGVCAADDYNVEECGMCNPDANYMCAGIFSCTGNIEGPEGHTVNYHVEENADGSWTICMSEPQAANPDAGRCCWKQTKAQGSTPLTGPGDPGRTCYEFMCDSQVRPGGGKALPPGQCWPTDNSPKACSTSTGGVGDAYLDACFNCCVKKAKYWDWSVEHACSQASYDRYLNDRCQFYTDCVAACQKEGKKRPQPPVKKVNVNGMGMRQNNVGEQVFVAVSASDDGEGTLTYDAIGLPPGLQIDETTGAITGTLASNAAASSPYKVTVSAHDAEDDGSTTFVWNVADPFPTPADPGGIDLTGPGALISNTGDGIHLEISATDAGEADLVYSAIGLPPGLDIDAATGVITGAIDTDADASSPFHTTITASDGAHSVSNTFDWTVGTLDVPWTNDIELAGTGAQAHCSGDQVSVAVVATETLEGRALTYRAIGLPPGLGIDPLDGTISGTLAPNAHASSPYHVSVTATDGVYSGGETFTWTVANQDCMASAVAPAATEENVVGDGISVPIGGPDLDYVAIGLPPGLSVDICSGDVIGQLAPDAQLASPYRVTVTDGNGVSQVFAWTVNDLPTPTSVPPAGTTAPGGTTSSTSTSSSTSTASSTSTFSAPESSTSAAATENPAAPSW